MTQLEETDSWMNEFVDLDTAGGECFVSFEKPPAGYRDGIAQTLSNAGAVIARPFPGLDVEHLEKPRRMEDVSMNRNHSDDYSIEESDEEEMAQLLVAVDDNPAPILPSGVVRKMDQDSRSVESSNSKLQFSSSGVSNCDISQADFSEPDLLDEDIDWDVVTACAKEATSSPMTKPLIEAARIRTKNALSTPAPIIRPPFPSKMRDRSVIVGLSSVKMMRTCFRIGELLNAHAKCAREKQDVVLELFARVNYSNRETSAKLQHFQLRDLFTDREPYLSGALRGWKLHGSVDYQSRTFLGPAGKNKLCRCICKLSEDKKTAIGRSAMVLSIRETNWDEVHWTLRLVARDAASDSCGRDEGVISSAT
ncbi:uncharacterized protein ColSpa_04412 [Colletotrichum spaethianum]|uniref:Uncharacterized protein n=1 Tax=Colletotrichum spaethianum TaxID=700344 RepID=A0AA37L8X4_9PEZI|nr:uncharacterized protein ColSpa_04412 [Colletotrichum spaethianum]GKT44231.1 hypothetical protein ColSpa_04412 [Colletotrichum spaethianum]